MILTAGLVGAIIIAFGRDKSSQAINFASDLVAGEKVSIPENPNWQVELGKMGIDTNPNQASGAQSAPETVTDTVAQSLMANYLSLKQNGTLDQTSAQKLIDQTINYVDSAGGKVTLISELSVVPDNGKQSMINYGENLGNVLKNNKPGTVKNEMEIAASAITSKDSSKMNELDSVIAVYQKVVNETTKMPVPKTFVKAHLDFVNGMNGIATALKEMKDVLNDPFTGLRAMQLYQDSSTMLVESENAIKVFINQNKIIYKQGSGGYYLLYGI